MTVKYITFVKIAIKVIMVSFCLVQAGCGPRYLIPASDSKPAQLTVSAYTQNGCIENLHEFARENGIEAKLLKVDADLGWEIILFPFYKGYRCFGESVVLPK